MGTKLETLRSALKKLRDPVVPARVTTELDELKQETAELGKDIYYASQAAEKERRIEEYRELAQKTIDADGTVDSAMVPVRDSWSQLQGAVARSEEIRERLERAVFLRGVVEDPPERLARVLPPNSISGFVLLAPENKGRSSSSLSGFAEILELIRQKRVKI